MKKILLQSAAVLCLLATLNSFTEVKHPGSQQTVGSALLPEPSTACFVQMNDGSIRHFKTLRLISGILITPHLLADEDIVIKAKDIMAYQNEKHYAVSPKILTSKKNSQVGVGTLPGFAIKLLSGKLNVYVRKYYNGGNTAEEYFLQSGEEGFIVSYTREMLKTMLGEDTKAMAFFNSKTKESKKTNKLLVAVEMYNTSQLMTKN